MEVDDALRVVRGSLGGTSLRSWLELPEGVPAPRVAETFIRQAQRRLRPLIDEVATHLDERDTDYVGGLVSLSGVCHLHRFPELGQLRPVFIPNGSPTKSSPEEQFARMLLRRTADLLTRVNFQRLGRCPECNRLFVAVRHQRFDTPQCASRDRVQRFRQKQKVARETAAAGRRVARSRPRARPRR